MGNNVPAKLGCGPCWTNGRKHENELGSFLYDAFIYTMDVEVVERFTYLGSDIHVSVGCESEANRCLGQAWGVMDSLDNGV